MGAIVLMRATLLGYSENLLKKIGKKRFEALKEKAKDYKKNGYKWSRSELEGLIEEFKINKKRG